MNKPWKLLMSVVLLAGMGLLLADYFALFGTSEKTELVFQEIQFRPLDDKTNSPIIGARIRCFQKGRKKDVCFQKDSGKLGIVSVMLPRTRIAKRSMLFEQSFQYSGSDSTDVNVMLMHLDYGNQVQRYSADELFSKGEKIYAVRMTPHYR